MNQHPAGADTYELTTWETEGRLRTHTVGRLCIIEHGYPVAFPVTYRVVPHLGGQRIVIRTSPRTAMARYQGVASIEVDEIDLERRTAWSVIARGDLHRMIGEHDLPDTFPLVADGRYQWIVLDVVSASGRRFSRRAAEEGFAVEWQPAGG